MSIVGNVLGGPTATMPMNMPEGHAQEPLVNLTSAAPPTPQVHMHPGEHTDVFGPPAAWQEGSAAFQATLAKAAGVDRLDIPMEEPLDKEDDRSPEKTQPCLTAAADPSSYSLTRVVFLLPSGEVQCFYQVVIINEARTCLVLAAGDPPPGAALFSPSASRNLTVIVGEGENAVRYTVVSFGATFRFDPWNMLVLAIANGPEDN